jgi:hypothetical protein
MQTGHQGPAMSGGWLVLRRHARTILRIGLSSLLSLLVLAGSVGIAPAVGAASPVGPSAVQDQDDEPAIPAGAGRIIGSPDPGPDPEHPGDRGGWAQFLTLGAIVGGVGFIMWRITSSARRARRPTTPGS